MPLMMIITISRNSKQVWNNVVILLRWSSVGGEGVENVVVDGAPVKITNLFFAASVSYRFGARAHLHLQEPETTTKRA